MPTLRQLLAEGAAQLAVALQATDGPRARLTAETLLAHVLGRERSYLYAHPEEELSPALTARWRRSVAARAAGTPLQYLTGEQEFRGRSFAVTPAVLIPRPETESVAAAALARIPAEPNARVLDVGTGSGCLAVTLALERPRASVVASDISRAALEVARGNARRLGAAVAFVQADLLAGIGASFLGAGFDLIVSNPPYVAAAALDGLQREVREHEPLQALVGGERGDEVYARLIPQAHAALAPGGWLVLELGYDSAPAVRSLLVAGWTEISTERDELGWERVLTARRTRSLIAP